ncbi:hypothetical protein KNZ06_12630 [Streptococcus dysgalactiae subsp. equisimilis]|nr:hypothetical protein KNZ06_12630 [Streptococcus dysgalactiae subsp. equisimilis]
MSKKHEFFSTLLEYLRMFGVAIKAYFCDKIKQNKEEENDDDDKRRLGEKVRIRTTCGRGLF